MLQKLSQGHRVGWLFTVVILGQGACSENYDPMETLLKGYDTGPQEQQMQALDCNNAGRSPCQTSTIFRRHC